MFNRKIALKRLERFLFQNSNNPEAAAETMAQIVGVFIGVKPAMEGDFAAEYADAKILWRFTKILDGLNLCIFFASTKNADGSKIYFVARSHKKASELEQAFADLWCKGPSPEIHAKVGALLGYPESAIRYFTRAHTDEGISGEHIKRGERNRFYAHSAAHEDEEFEAYEAPIYRQLKRYCPKTAKILSSNPDKRWLD